MNRYGHLAYEHTSEHRPKAFAAIADPMGHFSRMGEEVEARITQLRDQLLADRHPGETLEDYRRRSYQAARRAEEVVLAEELWGEPEERIEAEDEETLAYRSLLAATAGAMASADQSWTEVPPRMPPQK